MSFNTKNYTEQGGEKTVIGGEIEILPGAKIKADEGAEVEGFGGTLPIASETTLGGIMVGDALEIDEGGVLSVKKAASVTPRETTDVACVVEDLRLLITKLKEAGLMEAGE